MPYADRKKSKPVSALEKSEEYETCRNCSTLHKFGEPCPKCGLTFEEYEHRWDKFRKSE